MSFGILGTPRDMPSFRLDSTSKKMLDNQYVIVFTKEIEVFGPFDDEGAAITFGRSAQSVKGRWRVVPLKSGYGGDPWPHSPDPSLH